MRYVLVVGLWGLLLVGLYFGRQYTRSAPAVASSPTESAAAQAVAPPAARAPASPVAAEPRPVPTTAAAAPVAAKPDERDALNAEAAIGDTPTPAEQEGKLAHLYAHFRTDPVSPDATRDAQNYFTQEFNQKEIAPTAQHISCTDSLCRSRFSFPDLGALRRLANVTRNDDVAIEMGEPLTSDEGATIVIYFPTKGHKLPAAGGG